MPIQISQLKANTRTIVVPYFGDEVRLTYKPSELTPAVESQIRAASEDGSNGPMLDTLAKLIVEWDVLDEKDKALPHTPDVLESLPSPFLSAIFNEIREDMAPKPRSGRGSFAR